MGWQTNGGGWKREMTRALVNGTAVLLEPLNTLLGSLIKGRLALLIGPVTPQGETVDLIWRETKRYCDGVEVGWNRDERWVSCERGINTLAWSTRERLLCSQNGVSTSPAESDRAYLLRAWDLADLLDEAFNDGTSHSLSVLDQEWPKSSSYGRCGGRLLCNGTRFAFWQSWLDGLEKALIHSIALENIRDTNVIELVAKDIDKEHYRLALVLVLGFSNISRQPSDRLLTTLRCS
ncbi:hypothetical protein AC579_5075 [Pseudocercospora musae]|uniref:Uncharacterized protein n=1 Tax=Pseudocercospora musae TaxID=113226 RepID=A0A139IN33_9PEZI|nr:hypothetical protein AC579_5075 [Pseudocercospora musae]KXT16129.1 hypothetical protein AC579_5075 [Pseudocercospora musae]